MTRLYRLGHTLVVLIATLAPVAAQDDDCRRLKRTSIRFTVTGPLDDAFLGRVEDVITARLRGLDLKDVRVSRRPDAIVTVEFARSEALSTAQVAKSLTRLDTVVLATQATPAELSAAFGKPMSQNDLYEWMEDLPTSTWRALHWTPVHAPTRGTSGASPAPTYFCPWTTQAGRDLDDRGVFVSGNPNKRSFPAEFLRFNARSAKLTRVVDLVFEKSARRRLRALAVRMRNACVLLNGRCVFRTSDGPPDPFAGDQMARSGVYSLATGILGGDISGGFHEWVRQDGAPRRLALVASSSGGDG